MCLDNYKIALNLCRKLGLFNKLEKIFPVVCTNNTTYTYESWESIIYYFTILYIVTIYNTYSPVKNHRRGIGV